jgi:hypothetical protein
MHSALAPIDVLTRAELDSTLTHRFDAFIRDWYRGEDYIEINGTQPAGSGDALLPGPESGFAWSLKLASAIADGSSQNVPITAPAFTAAGSFTQNANPFPVAVTFTNGTGFNVFGGGAGGGAIGNGVSGPVTFEIGPYQAIGWNGGTVAPTAWTWSMIEPAYLSIYSGSNKVMPPIGVVPITTANGVSLAYETWSSNQVVLRGRDITLSFGTGIDVIAYKLMVKQVPAEMIGKL